MFPQIRRTDLNTVLAVMIGAGLFLLCACAGPGQAAATPADTPSPQGTSASIPTAPPVPTDTSLPEPLLATAPPDIGLPGHTSDDVTSAAPVADLATQVQAPVQDNLDRATIYSLIVKNSGPVPASGIVFTDVLSTGMVLVWTQAAQTQCGRQGSVVGCNLGVLQGGDVAAVTLDLSVAGTDILITSTQLAGVIWDLSASVPATTDLVLRTDAPQTVVAGQPFTFTFTITNRGESDASGVTFRDSLPPATELRAYKPDPPPCEQIVDMFTCHLPNPDGGAPVTLTLTITGHADVPMSLHLDPLAPGWPVCGIVKERSYLDIFNCNLGTLKRGEKTQVQLVLIARGVRTRALSNTAVVNAEAAELNTLDNTNTITITVRVQADLAIRPLISAPVVAGKHISYTFTISNDGPSDADGVLFSDTLPLGTTVVSAVPSQGEGCQIDGSTNRAICNMGRLDSGVTATVTVVVVADRLAATVSHTAHASAEQDDPNPTNNDWIGSIPVDAGSAP